MRSLLLFACCSLLAACQGHLDQGHLDPPAHRLAGTWTSTYDGAVVDILAEDDTSGIYIVQMADEDMTSFTGQFTATQTMLTIVNDRNGPCPGQKGDYEFAILNGVMQLTLETDECSERAEGPDYAWTRMFRASN